MRLKSKHVTLVALIVLTATPRALDQLTDLKNFAQERIRVELLSIFYGLTPRETRSNDARQDSELMASLQPAPACNGRQQQPARTRTVRTVSRLVRSTPRTYSFEPLPPAVVDEPVPDVTEKLIADASLMIDKSEELRALDKLALPGKQKSVLLDGSHKFVIVNRNHKVNSFVLDISDEPPVPVAPVQIGQVGGSVRPPTCMVR